MDKRNIIKTGDLVRWYDLYGDIHIVKNTGLGIVIEIVSYMFGDNESLIYKAKSNPGWYPKTSFEKLVKIMVTSDINRLKE